MNAAGVKFNVLNKNNYETWKIQMRAILIKNNAWGYADGSIARPEAVAGDNARQQAVAAWVEADLKAQSDIVLAMSPSEILQIKNCTTTREIWTRLEGIYQSKGPVRKAALLNQLISLKMDKDDDVREYSRSFFETVGKLAELDVEINQELLAVMLLRSLPESYENFRCAVSSRDDLPSLETLRIKIEEEFDARKNASQRFVPSAMVAKSSNNRSGQFNENRGSKNEKRDFSKRDLKIKCYKCGKIGHRAKNCYSGKKPNEQSSSNAEDMCFFTDRTETSNSAKDECFIANRCEDESLLVRNPVDFSVWCFDSGSTSHMCRDAKSFTEINVNSAQGTLNLANSACTSVMGKGTVSTILETENKSKFVKFENTLFVPDLRTNLISVGKVTDKGHTVIFNKCKAEIVDCKGKVLLTAERKRDLYYFKSFVDPVDKISEANVIFKTPKKKFIGRLAC